jgi:transposase-like protein
MKVVSLSFFLLDEKKQKSVRIVHPTNSGVGKQADKQRFKCAGCVMSFAIRNVGAKSTNQFVWFRKWIMQKS